MTRQEASDLLQGREYGSELTKQEKQQLKDNGLVVVYGYSDDLCEFEGAISDEVGCSEDDEILLLKNGTILTHEIQQKIIEVEGQLGIGIMPRTTTLRCIGYAPWAFEIEKMEFSIFDIMEDGEVYCKGIVFEIKDLK